ncbi:RNA polymerase sigma-70 factor (ECF subfamily) [Streptosporangium becharense]|uniref:RNA polymerase sigma-70 factor (ECF subfamily) n=1 Tax=Streptosporangium becharense TaxID=1816182 RepID=A0A7W9IBZ2_9ACTN|nr:RNA polymerase sigma factor [Streptosporangium becharense]MBB2915263.1 RNA polymerase sigma-70 factor (ECF subfamily) [Streptosporangium becharense]MBB5817908.1 RNA polymerase sigma-70 factor (ECF subfamily) [Streptosporangium becharense]
MTTGTLDAELDDEALLLAGARAGDETAFRALWAPVQRPAFGLCYHLTGHRADALDALQETQLAAWRGLHAFRGGSSFRAWVLVIARNAAYTVVRRRSQGVLHAEMAEDSVIAEPFEDLVAGLADLRRALAELPPPQREVLLLRAGGLAYEEVAASTGVPLNTVRVWIHRGRRRLRAALAEGVAEN